MGLRNIFIVIVAVFAIGRTESFPDRATRREIERLAAETGGRAWMLDDLETLETVYRRIAELLRARYLVTFTAPSDAGAGPRRLEIEVERPGARVEAQSAYRP